MEKSKAPMLGSGWEYRGKRFPEGGKAKQSRLNLYINILECIYIYVYMYSDGDVCHQPGLPFSN